MIAVPSDTNPLSNSGLVSLDFSAQDREKLSNAKMGQIAKEYMSKMGITDTQYIIGRHYDKDIRIYISSLTGLIIITRPSPAKTTVTAVRRFAKN
jgi:hypothetical protein